MGFSVRECVRVRVPCTLLLMGTCELRSELSLRDVDLWLFIAKGRRRSRRGTRRRLKNNLYFCNPL
jgi:hypothetical protein